MYHKLLEYIVLPIGDLFNKSSYLKQLNYWRKVDSLSEKELQSLQEKNLKRILEHAVHNIAHYQHIKLVGKDPYAWLQQFPVLTKDILRKKNTDLIKPTSKNLIKYNSSGSSGKQSVVYMNSEEQSVIRGILTHWWEWSGYKVGKPLVQTGMTLKRNWAKTFKDYFFNTLYINAFSLSEAQLKTVAHKLNFTNKYYLAGYASSLNVIAEYVLKNNYNIKMKAVISLGDKLFPHYKKNIEKAFNCSTFDTYGSNEGLMIAAQKDLEYMYILSPHVYIEIVDDSYKPVKDGEMGHLLVTRLDGFTMPLIRYKIGDLGVLLPRSKYPKRREFNYPLLQQIIGRETDIVKLPSGKKLIVHSFTGIFEYIPEIIQFKVIQEEISKITIEFIKGDGFTNIILNTITEELQKYIQDSSFKIDYKEVNVILPSKSGKPQIIVSKL